jgi:hypothetical protein
MTTTTRLSGTLELAGRTLDVAPVVTLDRGWAPYATAEVTVPGDDDLFDDTDPRTSDLRGVVTVRQDFYESTTLADASAGWAGLTLDDLSDLWGDLTLDDLSDLWGDRWGNATWRAAETLQLDLGVRSRDRDFEAGTITYVLASDERLAQETAGTGWEPGAQGLAARFASILTLCHLDPAPTVDLGAWAGSTTPAAAFTPDDTAWDQLAASAGPLGLRPWCDESRVWRVMDPADAPNRSIHLARFVTARDLTSRDGEWADQALSRVTYTLGGVPYANQAWYPDPGSDLTHHKVTVVSTALGVVTAHQEPRYDPEAHVRRTSAHGRQVTGRAPIDLAVRPGMALTTGAPSLPALSAEVDSVRFDVPAAQMTITTTDTVTGA